MTNEQAILDGVLAEFAQLAKIPRPSGHEEAVSGYLKGALMKLGIPAEQDDAKNIIADLPASPGYEGAPRTILQGHMDMVCAAADGVAYRPADDPIRLVRSDDYLAADGTSLGADDGIGIAEILWLFKHPPKPHGPLRAIFTVQEETGMYGAAALDRKHLADARFCLNCDSEEDDLLTVGSAGGVDIEFSRPIHWQPPGEGQGWRLSIAGLSGGHSGEDIGKGRGNAIRLLAALLLDFAQAGLPFAVASLSGGIARNAIAAAADAVLLTAAPGETIRALLARRKARFLAAFGAADPGLTMSLDPAGQPPQVIDAEAVAAVTGLISVLHSGVFAMSTAIAGLVETSANLGLLRTEEDRLYLTYYPRSGLDEKLPAFQRAGVILGERFGCPAQIGTPLPAWQERPDSPLAKLVAEVFAEQRGRAMRVAGLHAGLECAHLQQKNPRLDIVSIGPTTLAIHSPRERLVLATVVPQIRLMAEVLRRIARLE